MLVWPGGFLDWGFLLPVGCGAPGLCLGGQCLLLSGEGSIAGTWMVGGGSEGLWLRIEALGPAPRRVALGVHSGLWGSWGWAGLRTEAGAREWCTTACAGGMLLCSPGPAWSGLPFRNAPAPSPRPCAGRTVRTLSPWKASPNRKSLSSR